jgi:hypothetical protein
MPLLKTAKYPICIVFSLLYCQLSFADPYRKTNSDFGGVGLLQMPNARMMKDGNLSIGCSSIQPYNRCYFNTQVFPWMEALFRYTSITNRLKTKVLTSNSSYLMKTIIFHLWLLVFVILVAPHYLPVSTWWHQKEFIM